MRPHFSQHADIRIVQRSIPTQVVEWLIEYGNIRRSDGCDVYSFDKRSRRALQKAIGDSFYRRIKALIDCYAVVADDGDVVTVAHRLRRPQGCKRGRTSH